MVINSLRVLQLVKETSKYKSLFGRSSFIPNAPPSYILKLKYFKLNIFMVWEKERFKSIQVLPGLYMDYKH